MQFACVLDFHNDDFTFGILRLYINTIELVICSLLVPFAFQNLDYFYFLIQEHREETF